MLLLRTVSVENLQKQSSPLKRFSTTEFIHTNWRFFLSEQ